MIFFHKLQFNHLKKLNLKNKLSLTNCEIYLNSKPLYYDKIDYDVIVQAWNILKKYISLPYVIHIVGTNGKGTTGRFLASFLSQLKFSTLHYSSPHILKFNERIWINGKDVSNDTLNKAHENLFAMLPTTIEEKLTYFEYTTLLSLLLSNNLDYLVLEAGLGGEFDATNVVTNDLTIVPTIGLDHVEFLGDTIKKIAETKLRSCDKSMILGENLNHDSLGFDMEMLNLQDNINIYHIEEFSISLPSFAKIYPLYLQSNLKLALVALEYMNINYICEKLIPINLFGRCQKLTSNITIDVGHNALAATALLEEFKSKKIILIYNSYKDKDFYNILKILYPIIMQIEIINIDDNRMASNEDIKVVCRDLRISVKKFDKIDNSKQYLVFGSFKVVEAFLQKGNF